MIPYRDDDKNRIHVQVINRILSQKLAFNNLTVSCAVRSTNVNYSQPEAGSWRNFFINSFGVLDKRFFAYLLYRTAVHSSHHLQNIPVIGKSAYPLVCASFGTDDKMRRCIDSHASAWQLCWILLFTNGSSTTVRSPSTSQHTINSKEQRQFWCWIFNLRGTNWIEYLLLTLKSFWIYRPWRKVPLNLNC
jgi:hypothetical protein